MPGTDGRWATTRFVDPDDMRHDMHVTIVTFQPGGSIPFAETHVMEHGLYVLEGKGVYRLNNDWVEVEAGDFMWLRAFCPQACYAGGPGPFRYLLYKDVNRHMKLVPGLAGRITVPSAPGGSSTNRPPGGSPVPETGAATQMPSASCFKGGTLECPTTAIPSTKCCRPRAC